MKPQIITMIYSYCALAILFALAWFACFRGRIFAWVDFFWAASFLVVLLIHQAVQVSLSGGLNLRLIDLMYAIWASRLSYHLYKRIRLHGEDRRYVSLKSQWKVWYGLKFFLLFQAQAVLTVVLSIPLVLNYASVISPLNFLALALFGLALTGESISDLQLKHFLLNNPGSKKVCNVGLWKYSRHPNYFFEWMIWISFGIYGLTSEEAWPALIPAVVMYVFLTKITGIPPAEESSINSKGEIYRQYQKTTNAFFPWLPKVALYVVLYSLAAFTITPPIYAKEDTLNQQERIKHVFKTLRADNLNILDGFYDPKTVFVDPIGSHNGIQSVKDYYQNLYQNVKSIDFAFSDIVSNGDTHVLIWTMTLEAEGLNGGKPIFLEGNSYIKFNEANLVAYHRDYFDMGEFIYEHVPVLGWTIKKIKDRLKATK
jgi:steroid 5-alpha reductase family enzyme